MRQLPFLLVIILLFGCEKTDSHNPGDAGNHTASDKVSSVPSRYMYISAADGLNVRKKPDISSQTIAAIPYKARIAVVKESDKEVSLSDSVRGKWYFITYNNIRGWVFSYYLTDSLDETSVSRISDFIQSPYAGYNEISKNNKKTRGIVSSFGTPQNITRKEVDNPHNGSKDVVEDIQFPEISFKVYKAVSVGREFINNISISRGFSKTLNHNIRFGTPMKSIVQKYGNPRRKTSDTLVYEAEGPMNDTVTFVFADNGLEKITISYGLD